MPQARPLLTNPFSRLGVAGLLLLGVALSACAPAASTATAPPHLTATVSPTQPPPPTVAASLPPEVVTGPPGDETPASETQDGTHSPRAVTATPDGEAANLEEPPAERAYPIVLEGHAASVKSAEFGPDGTRVVTASDDATAIIWDVLAGAPVALLEGHSKPLTSAHFDSAGARVVTSSYDRTARVWDAASGQQLAVLVGHEEIVNDARFDPGGNRIVTASEDGTARIWDAQTGVALFVLRGNGGPVKSAIFRPDSSQVATAHAGGTVHIWDTVVGSELFVLPESVREGERSNLAVRAILFSQDGSRLVAAGEDGSVNLWDTDTGATLLRINAHGRGVTWVDLSSNGTRIVSASFMAGVANVWDATDGSALAAINHGGIINDVALSPDGTIVATVGSDPAPRIWDAVSGETLGVLEGHTGAVYAAAFNPNGEELVTASADGTARIWDVSVAAGEGKEEAATGPPAGLSAGGPWWLLAGTDGLWAVNVDGTGATRISERDFGYYNINITGWAAPRGGHLAYITAEDHYYNPALHITTLPHLLDEAVIRLTVDATEPSRDATPGDPALDAVAVAVQDDSFAWSPDGRWLAFTGMLEGPTSDLYVYDTITDQITRLTDGPTQAVRPMWSADGRFILHTALEGANVDTGRHVQAFWVAARDDSGVTLVNQGEDQLVGWASTDEFIIYSIDTICGAHDLRAVDVGGEKQPIWEGYLNRVAYEPESGTVLVAIWADIASSAWCNVDQGQGLFLTSADGTPPLRIVEDEVREIVWSSEARLFFARTDYGILAVSRSGDFIDLAVPQGSSSFPQVAAGTRELAWRGAGLWVGSLTSSIDQPPQQIYPSRVGQVTWAPDGSHVLFTVDGSLYTAQRPDFAPEFVSEIGAASSAVWVVP
jgi:WD40 repeat protein